jgi:type I restriction-modification system DNA methylase subunit
LSDASLRFDSDRKHRWIRSRSEGPRKAIVRSVIWSGSSPTSTFAAADAEGDDLLGDAYEYLMRHFATESGKSKGQFYTPAEVSRILAKVVGIGPGTKQDQTVYDPTCGSGSLLLKVADEAPRSITIYGQENIGHPGSPE